MVNGVRFQLSRQILEMELPYSSFLCAWHMQSYRLVIHANGGYGL
jgi:hypothetical protein